MKIGIVAENYFPTLGGIQEHIYNLAKQLLLAGHEVKVITGMPAVAHWMGPKEESFVIRVGKARTYGVMGTYTNFTLSPKIAKKMRRVFKEENFDVLHIHGPCDFGLPILAYKYFKGPKVATLHSAFKDSWSRRLVKGYYKWVLKNSNAIIAVSQHAANSLLRYAAFDYQIIPNGVDVKYFDQGKKIKKYDDTKINLLYLGRVEARNGLDVLFKALPKIIKQHPEVRVLVGGDGPELKNYTALLDDECRAKVKFLGAVYQERADLYKTADLFVLPNRFGGTFSIMVLEALAAGTPVVSTPFVPQECRNHHWDSTFICADHSPEALAKGILKMLTDKQSERITFGKKIVQEFDWQYVAKNILSTYQKIIHEHSN